MEDKTQADAASAEFIRARLATPREDYEDPKDVIEKVRAVIRDEAERRKT